MAVPERQKILVVDDDESQRLLLRMTLESRFLVLEAGDGRAAVSILENDPDVRFVITDLNMPVMDGFTLVEQIRGLERLYTYIIVLTTSDDRKSITRALRAGADDYITKPVFEEELFLRLASGQRILRIESQEALILSMAKIAEFKSLETGRHLERVRQYSRLLAMDIVEHHPGIGLTPVRAEEIARVSPLHDIGKVTVPDGILHKPGRLTDDEFEQIKEHTVNGGKILKDLYEQTGDSYLLVACNVALYHHERWDGSGYPEGLRGEAIPLEARIVALADVYDAISSRRCYKESLPHSEVAKIILQEKGAHFDPLLVESFFRQQDIIMIVRKRFADPETS